MPQNKGRFILLCQQALATATVLAVMTPAASMITLDIAAPEPPTAGAGSASPRGEASLVATQPVKPDVVEVEVDGVDQEGLDAVTPSSREQRIARRELAALSAPEPVTGYATVGVTWEPGNVVNDEDIAISVRTIAEGTWSDWEDVEYHDDHGPDLENTEGSTIRPGTDPIVVGDVDEVQVKAVTTSGEAPADMEMSVVDPGSSTATEVEQPAIDTASSAKPDADASLASSDISLSAARAAKPKIYSRAQWGADERMRDKGSLRYGTIKAGFVHHTVNANGYSSAQVPSLIRGIYAYHTQSRGWSDVGYNFIVDRFGRIWEGRYGGVSRPVVGAHTLSYNDYSFAMSALGNFDTAHPPAAMLRAYGRLFAWKLSLHRVKAADKSQRVGSGTFRAISGHRDAGATACPGRHLYAKLPRIRDLATKYQKGDDEPPPPDDPDPPIDPKRDADISGSSWPDLVVRDKTSKRAFVVETGGQVAFESAKGTGQSLEGMDLLTGTRDITGDRIADMVARNSSTRSSGIYPGDGNGGFGNALTSTTKFSKADQLTSVGDFDGDGENDLVSRDAATHSLYLHPGNGDGGFLKKRLLASSWSYHRTVGVGDFDGDGGFDIAARDRKGALQLFRGKGHRLRAPTALIEHADVFDLIAGMGDLTNDGNGDIVVRNAESRSTYIYPGDGRGGLGRRIGPFARFKGLDFLATPGQVAGSNDFDLVGRRASGRLVSYANTGRSNISAVTTTGTTLDTANLMVNVGDWNDDGHGDLITRSGNSGKLYLRKGDGSGQFGKPVRAATGWASVRSVSAVGDVTGDGNPDLVGQPKGEVMRTYAGDGSSGFLESRRSRAWMTRGLSAGSPNRYDWMLNVGDANGDGRPDLIARQKGTGRLWLMPGADDGFSTRRLIAGGFASYDLGG